MESNVCTCTPRTDEDLRLLTGRMHSYISRMKELKSSAVHEETSSFFQLVETMETEISNMKETYGREILRLRKELQDVSQARNNSNLRNDKLEASTSDMRIRIAAEIAANQQLREDINVLRAEMHQKERDFQQALLKAKKSKANDKWLSQCDSANQQDQSQLENQELVNKYEAELLRRRNLEDKAQQLQKQIDFNEKLNNQRTEELQIRLNATTAAIQTLESKAQMVNRPAINDNHISQMMAGVRGAAERDFAKYKTDSEEAFSRNVTMLKAQVEAGQKALGRSNEEISRLTASIEELNTKLRTVQAEMVQLTHGKRAAEDSMHSERNRLLTHIRSLETKMKEMQQEQFEKMKELNSARIQYLPLKAEVESLRALMEEEEKRISGMRLPTISQSTSKSMVSTQYHNQREKSRTGMVTYQSTQFTKKS